MYGLDSVVTVIVMVLSQACVAIGLELLWPLFSDSPVTSGRMVCALGASSFESNKTKQITCAQRPLEHHDNCVPHYDQDRRGQS